MPRPRIVALAGRPCPALPVTGPSIRSPAPPTASPVETTRPRLGGGEEIDRGAGLSAARRVGFGLLGVQLSVMLAFSTVEYGRYALGVGFGTYAQAWAKIARGHLDPWSTLIGKSFWHNDSEFVLWPLALLYHLFPHPVTLLWVQDVALVATEALCLTWILEVVDRSWPQLTGNRIVPVAIGLVCVMVAEPFVYFTAGYDFHSEVLATLFVVMAGRALWSGRTRQLWVAVPLALSTSALAGLYVAAIGVSGVIGARASRRKGIVVAGAGAAWFLLLGTVGGSEFGYAHSLTEWYGYLAGPHSRPGGTLRPSGVLVAVVRHPLTAAHMAVGRWDLVLLFLLAVGLLGVLSPWGFPMAAAVFVPSALNANIAFLNPLASFQSWPALPFVLVGSVMVMTRLASGTVHRRRVARIAGVSWAVAVVVLAGALVPKAERAWVGVDRQTAGRLAQIDRDTPARAEVIASSGVVGRFSVRDEVYAYGPLSRSFPVRRRVVVFVLTPTARGRFGDTPASARRAVEFVRHRLGARDLVVGGGVYGLVWSAPPTVTRVVLP
jgi:uncharacterized membrane protein